jgi:hypothetical protein
MMDYSRTCDSVGPWVKISPTYQTQLRCNRVLGHDDEHQHRDRQSFAIVASWTESAEPDERKRKKITR